MRILKCYLANNSRNQFVDAKEAAKTSDDAGYWTCASCGCELILQKGGMGELPRFDHIPHSVSHQQLMKCAWVDSGTGWQVIHAIQFSLFILVASVKQQIVINTVLPGKACHVGIRLHRQFHKMKFELRGEIKSPTFFGYFSGGNRFVLLAFSGVEKPFKLLR